MEAVSALKVGCGKFFHGEGVISLLAGEIMRLGGKALLVGGPTSVDRVMDAARESLDAAGVSCVVRRHTDYCTVAWAETYAALARSEGCTVLVGVGGGKCIDEMKCAAHFAGLPIITVPTSIATCVATSMVCIMYNEKGQRAPAVNLSKEVDVCIADTGLIASAPRRTLAAGILDSMAKMPECFHQKKIGSYRDCTLEEYIQVVNSRAIFEFLMGEGRDLYKNGGAAQNKDRQPGRVGRSPPGQKAEEDGGEVDGHTEQDAHEELCPHHPQGVFPPEQQALEQEKHQVYQRGAPAHGDGCDQGEDVRHTDDGRDAQITVFGDRHSGGVAQQSQGADQEPLRKGGPGVGRRAHFPAAMAPAMTMRWTWLVPSKICHSLASRISFSTGYSRE